MKTRQDLQRLVNDNVAFVAHSHHASEAYDQREPLGPAVGADVAVGCVIVPAT
jgi:hypothetical protein